jgi:hypothetical protein
MAFEAFVGVLFAGFVSAIMIGKVARLQSIAQIAFSDAICIRYGTAAALEDDEDDEIDIDDECFNSSGNLTDLQNIPFPILEFRMINLLSREHGGEILNASVSIVASVIENDCESSKHIGSLRVKNEPPTSTKLVGMAAETTTKAVRMVGTVGTMAVTTGTKAAVSTVKCTGAALLGVGKRATGSTGSLLQQLVRQVQWTPKDTLDSLDGSGTLSSPFEFNSDLVIELEEKLVENFEREQALLHGNTSQEVRTFFVVDEGNSILAPPRTYHKLEVRVFNSVYVYYCWFVAGILN